LEVEASQKPRRADHARIVRFAESKLSWGKTGGP
jgi:hypothetical protein